MSKAKNLENMVNKSLHKPTESTAKSDTIKEPSDIKAKNKATSKNGLVQIGVHLEADFKSSLRLAQLRNGRGVYINDLVAEALNDLFRKYDVPTVHHE